MEITIGTCKTPAALMVSKNKPSEVEAFPIVPQATSFPSLLNFSEPSKETSLYTLEAWARPSNLGIWPAVGLMSDELLYC